MKKLGILGGGQLAQMLTQSAISLGIETAIFERFPDSPASRLTKHDIAGEWVDKTLLDSFAQLCDVITLENEFVDASILQLLEDSGVEVFPTATTLSHVQDKLIQKQTMQAAGIPLPGFHDVKSPNDVIVIGDKLGWPLVLKARRDGYDGYGNATLQHPDDVAAAWEHLAKNGGKLFVETYLQFERELAIMILRGRNGEIRHYPVVETIQHNHICHIVRAPATITKQQENEIITIASKAVEAIHAVGVFGVELFQLKDGSILYNEIAPRPHNSGHYTIEACITSQFENHIRAVLGWSLGSTAMITPAAVMVNVLGSRDDVARSEHIAPALTIDNAHLHIYAKARIRKGRKMGHVTVLGNTIEQAEAQAIEAVNLVDL